MNTSRRTGEGALVAGGGSTGGGGRGGRTAYSQLDGGRMPAPRPAYSLAGHTPRGRGAGGRRESQGDTTPRPRQHFSLRGENAAICSRCGKRLSIEQFARDGSKASGHRSWCKQCEGEKGRRYYKANRARKLAASNARAKRKRVERVGKNGPRKCKTCDAPALSERHWYCAACRDKAEDRRAGRKRKRLTQAERERHRRREAGRPNATDRGYGHRHQQERKRWKPEVDAGRVACARCGRLIAPGEPWDLGHDDHDRSIYTGPEHRRCNRATAGRRKRRQSRRW